MPSRRRMRHVGIDLGGGNYAMVRMRGPMTPDLEAAFTELARTAVERLKTDGEREKEKRRGAVKSTAGKWRYGS